MARTRVKLVPEVEYRALLHEKLLAAMAEGSNPEETLAKILDRIKKTRGFERYLVFFHDREKDLSWVLGCRGFAKEDAKRISYTKSARKHAITPMVATSGKYYFTTKAEHDDKIDKYWSEKLPLRGPLLAMPLKIGKVVCGVLVINDQHLTENDAAVLGPFVNDLAIAVTAIEQTERLRAREKIIGLMKRVQFSFVEAQDD